MMTKDALRGSREKGRNRLDWHRGEPERRGRRGFKCMLEKGKGERAIGEEVIVSWVGRGAASWGRTGRVQRGGRSLREKHGRFSSSLHEDNREGTARESVRTQRSSPPQTLHK